MYTFSLKLFNPAWVNTAIYLQLAETYRLPSIDTLLVSMEKDVAWACDPSTQVYYLDNLREAVKRDIFEVRFKTSERAREYTDLFLSVKDYEVHLLTFSFGGRGDRRCSSRVIGWLKEIAKKQAVELEFEVEGVAEKELVRFIREHSLSAFQWNARLERYLHVTDDYREVKEVKRGIYR